MGFFARNAHKSTSQILLGLLTIFYRNKSEVRLYHYPHLIMLLLKTRFRSDYRILIWREMVASFQDAIPLLVGQGKAFIREKNVLFERLG